MRAKCGLFLDILDSKVGEERDRKMVWSVKYLGNIACQKLFFFLGLTKQRKKVVGWDPMEKRRRDICTHEIFVME